MPYRRKDTPFWYASFTGPDGKKVIRSTGTADRREAEALEAKWKLDAFQQKHWDKAPSRSFDELMLAYLESTQDEKRSAERDVYSLKHLAPFFTGRDLSGLGPVDVRAYVDLRKQAGAKPATINKEVGLLSAALNYARREWEWDVPNPAANRKLKEPSRIRWISRAEAAGLIQEAGKEYKARHLPDFIRLAINTGCRKGELLGLEWRRVDWSADLLYLEEMHSKNGKPASVPLNADARQALLNRAKFRAQHCPDSPWVFCHKNGKRIQQIQRSFRASCERAGIADFHIHDLRHTCASWLVQSGVDLLVVMQILRHSDIRMTQRYAHLAPRNVSQAVRLLEGGLQNGYSSQPDGKAAAEDMSQSVEFA